MKTSFNKKKHEYLIDGKLATGVTTIISVLAKPALIQWAANEAVKYLRAVGVSPVHPASQWYITDAQLEEARTAHTKKKEAAGTHGTSYHELVEEWIDECLEDNGGAPIYSAETDPAWAYQSIMQFIVWANENVDHFLFAERKMYNKRLFIAGTADFAYVGNDGRRYIADFKTSSGIYGIDYWLQVAAYRMLAEEEGDEPYDGATIVRMGKDGSFDVQQLYEYETYKEAFLCCLTLYRAQAAIKGLIVK